MTMKGIQEGRDDIAGEVVGVGGPSFDAGRRKSSGSGGRLATSETSESVNFIDATYTVNGYLTLLALNPRRKYLLIQNLGPNEIRVSFGKRASTKGGVSIPSGGYYEPYKCPISSVNVVDTAAGSTRVTVVEGY